MKYTVNKLLPFVSVALFLCCAGTALAESPKKHDYPKASSELAKRIMGERAGEFSFETITAADEKDVFEVEAIGDKIVIRGNNGVSMASGLNWYLTQYCNSQVSLNYSQISLPETLPTIENKIRRVTPFQRRNFFNYCTFGYTMPWWDWQRWEQMIDYLAMHGVNMPLAITGQEAVWQAVFLDMGLTQKHLDDFFVGPAHLPWGWMSNIDGLGGPLPQGWIDGQKALQKKILARQRSLGMTPLLQGFAGHVPAGIKENYPNAKIHKVTDWACMPGVNLLDPTDPLFREIGKRFIEKQTEMYGTDHLYNADCFNEVNPHTNDPAFIAKVGESVYGSMTAADPEAIWVFQGWFLNFQRDFWKKPQASALLSAVPSDRMIGLDLSCELTAAWKRTEAFYGKQWVWNIFCPQGQKINISGDLQLIDERLQEALGSPDCDKMVGIGMMMEGFGYNPIAQEFVLSKTWSPQQTDLKQWVEDYSVQRYGIDHPKAKEAWKLMLEGPYSRNVRGGTVSRLIYTPSLSGKVSARKNRNDNTQYDHLKATEALAALLECSDQLKDVDTYQFDVVHITREMLDNYAASLIDKMNVALAAKDVKTLKTTADEFLTLIKDMDAICGTNEKFMLGKWLEDAKAKATNDKDRSLYEFNARTILTMWEPAKQSCLRDYAARQWNGLLGDFYYFRWQLYLDGLVASLENDTKFDFRGYLSDIKDFEMDWIRQTNEYPYLPTGESVTLAADLLERYRPLQAAALANRKAAAETEQKKNMSLATGKPVTCSGGTQGSHGPENAVDGDISNGSGWHNKSGNQWLQVDLGDVCKVETTKLYTYHDNKRHYTYFIEVSTDGEHYDQVVDMRNNTSPSTAEGFEHHFNPMDTRYVRVTMLSNSANQGVHINEILVH